MQRAGPPALTSRGPAMTDRLPGFSTLAIHAGAQPDPTTGARATPIYQTTSFVFEDVDHAASLFGLQTFGNIYTRIGNPTNAVLEERVAALEGGTAGLAVASGHAAQVLVFHVLMKPGDEFVAAKKLYGGSINQFNHSFKNFGWNVVWADPDDIGTFERGISPKTKAIFIESIANPGGVITDIEAIANIARRAGVPLIVDNTLATPYLCKPIDYGADVVVHSLTKFLGGHGNSIGGLIVDGGTFNWSREGRYPMLSEPRPEYHGIVLHATFGARLGQHRIAALARPVEGAAVDDQAADRVAVAAEEFGQRVHHDVGAVVDRLAQVRRRQGVVDDQRHAGAARDVGDRLDVGDDAARIGDRLDEDRLGLRADAALERADVVRIGPHHVPAEILERVVELVDRAAIELLRRDELVARLHQHVEDQHLRGMAGSDREAGGAALERGDALLEHGVGRVADAGVDVAERLQAEQRGGMVDVLEHE